MRNFHLIKHGKVTPTINVERLWSLVSEQTRAYYAEKKDKAPVIDVMKAGYMKVMGKGKLPEQPVIVKARYFTKEAEATSLHLVWDAMPLYDILPCREDQGGWRRLRALRLSDPSMRDAVMADPQVQAAIQKAGKDALQDPAVQAQILATVQEKFPAAATAAKDKIKEWANDPEVQKQAYKMAGVAADAAWRSVSEVSNLIEQGPAGVR
ncbi:unnamed protein product, partial [Polarella glacialis]